MTYDVEIIIKTFYMSSRSNDENFVSIRQVVAEKNSKVLWKQTNEPKGNTLSFGEGNKNQEMAYHQWVNSALSPLNNMIHSMTRVS